MPTLNSESTIAEALLSIRKQSYRNLEVLILDGLSTDGTISIAQKFQGFISNLKIISEKDNGIYDAMNKGIKLASGNWLYFMGADDTLFDKDTLANIMQIDDINTYDVLYGNVVSSRFEGIYAGEFSYKKLAQKNICHQAIFFNREVFYKIGFFNLNYKAHADWDHNIRWFFSPLIIKRYIPQIIANYADGGYSSINRDEKFEKIKDFKIIIRGLGKMPLSQLLVINEKALINARQNKDYVSINLLLAIKAVLRCGKRIFKLYGK